MNILKILLYVDNVMNSHKVGVLQHRRENEAYLGKWENKDPDYFCR